MSSLYSITYKELIKKMRTVGFHFDRQAKGSHEIWYNPVFKASGDHTKSSWDN